MQDSRTISPKLLKAFTDEKEGALYSFLHFAKRHDELNVYFRGNNNAIEIYYLNHRLWILTLSRNDKYKVSFNFNYANCMPDRMDYLKSFEMGGEGFTLKNDGKIEWVKDFFSKEDINDELWQIFKDIMDFNFDPIKESL